MRVIIVRVGRKPLIEDIPEDRKSIKKIIGGIPEKHYPYKDKSVVVITSPESLEVNRWIVDESGQSKFIARGNFIIAKIDAAKNICGFTGGEAMLWKKELER